MLPRPPSRKSTTNDRPARCSIGKARHREDEHRTVEPDLVHPRQVDRVVRDQGTDPDPCHEGAAGAADQCQHQALRQERPSQSPAPGAEGRPDGNLPLARFSANEKQIRDVRSRDQQYERDRTQEDPQHRGHLAHQPLLQRCDCGKPAGTIEELALDVRESFGDASLQHGDLLLREVQRDARRQTRKSLRTERTKAARRIQPKRNKEASARIGKGESFGHDADNLRANAVDVDAPADHARVTTEVGLPEPMRENDNERRVLSRVRLAERAAM